MDSLVTDINIKLEIQNLLTRKMDGEELNEEPKIQILNDFLEQKIFYYNEYVKTTEQLTQPDTARLNKLFKETIDEAWNPNNFETSRL